MSEIVRVKPEFESSPVAEGDGIETAIAHYGTLTQFVSRVLKSGIDYGVIPRTKKPTLYKAGAEKLCQLFNLRPSFELVASGVTVI